MKYTQEERLDIGRRIYNGELTRFEAATQYGVSENTARDYMRLYRDVNQLPPKKGQQARLYGCVISISSCYYGGTGRNDKRRIDTGRRQGSYYRSAVKKGYEVKGDGSVILYGSKNIK